MVKRLYGHMNAEESFEVGKTYWVYIVELNGKHSGLATHVKPFPAKLLSMKKRSPDYWLWGDLNFDFSQLKKKVRQPDAAIWFHGYICDTEEECKRSYNLFMDNAVKEVKSYLSYKFNRAYIKTITDCLINHKYEI